MHKQSLALLCLCMKLPPSPTNGSVMSNRLDILKVRFNQLHLETGPNKGILEGLSHDFFHDIGTIQNLKTWLYLEKDI